MSPNLKKVKAKDIKVGDIIAFNPYTQWHQYQVSSVDVNSMGNYIVRTGSDTASHIYEPNEHFVVVM